MDEPIFSGSAEIQKNDLKEAAKRTLFGNLSGMFLKLFLAFMLLCAFLSLLIIAAEPKKTGTYGGLLIMSAGYTLIYFLFFHIMENMKIKAPINQNIHAEIFLYEDRLSYSTEYVSLNAKYSDVSRLHCGKYSIVIEFKGADYIIVPIRCFGRSGHQAAKAFLQKKIKEASAG